MTVLAVLSGAITFCLSLSWPISIYYILRRNKCTELAWACISHEVTFTIVHHSVFVIAIANLVAISDLGRVVLLSFWPELACWAALVFLLMITTKFSCVDFVENKLEPYLLRQDSCRFLRLGRDLRKEYDRLQSMASKRGRKDFANDLVGSSSAGFDGDNEYKIAVDKYKINCAVYSESRQPLKTFMQWRKRCNWASYVHFGLNCYFAAFIGYLVWYTTVNIVLDKVLNKDCFPADGVLVTLVLLTLWFPFRMYASWYQTYFLGEKWWVEYAAFWVVCAIAALFAIILYMRGDSLPSGIAAFNGLAIAILTLSEKFKWRVLPRVKEALDAHWIYAVAVYVMLFIICFLAMLLV